MQINDVPKIFIPKYEAEQLTIRYWDDNNFLFGFKDRSVLVYKPFQYMQPIAGGKIKPYYKYLKHVPFKQLMFRPTFEELINFLDAPESIKQSFRNRVDFCTNIKLNGANITKSILEYYNKKSSRR